MLGLHLVWCLWFNQKPIIIQDAREGVECLIKALKNRQNTMECLLGLPASSTVTQKGTFWFCGENLSCEFFCPDQDCYMFGKAVTAYRESGCVHPRCYGHGRLESCEWLKIRITRTMVDHSLCVPKEIIPVPFGNGVMCSKVSSPFADML